MKKILQVDNVSKRFFIDKAGDQPYLSIRNSFNALFKKRIKEEFWALRNVTFDVNEGESIGIIGRNGAGKSTLLKVLSQITPPTSGSITSRGRIASLLEVGTGFHPELTGRENIFLNGSILGMKRNEILKNFEAIVDFSEVGRFLDTPVKHYSSGMQLRLAFAVAAFLENEILIIDEVLAVGDAEFQKKCLGKMNEVSNSGRTVLFVSHNIGAVKRLCTKGVVLNKGQVECFADIDEATKYYQLSNHENNKLVTIFENNSSNGNNNIRLIALSATSDHQEFLSVSKPIHFEITFECKLDNINLDCTTQFNTIDGIVVFHTGALVTENKDSKKGKYSVRFSMPSYYLNSGEYSISLIFGKDQSECLFNKEYAFFFIIENDVTLGRYNGYLPGILRPNFKYQISHEEI